MSLHMLMNTTQNLFAGKMSINGLSTGASSSSPETSPYQKLKTGLRVDNSPAAGSQTAPAPKSAEKTGAGLVGPDQTKIQDKFNAEMTARLKAAQPKNAQEAETLADSLTAVAEEIKSEFGQDKANEFMSRMLTATDGRIRENGLAEAVGGFFKDLAREAADNPELSGKLSSIRNFLNQGLELGSAAGSEQNQPESENPADAAPGLSAALNQYFGQKALVSEDGQSVEAKGFDTSFDRVALRLARQTETDGDEAAQNWVILRDPNKVNPAAVSVDDNTWQMTADYLRTAVGNEKAAAFFENGSGNLFEAAAASVAVVAEENGQEAAYDFVKYLNENVAAQGLGSNGFSFQGWRLGRDYSQPGAPVAGPPQTPKDGGFGGSSGLWVGDSEMGDIIEDRQHQGLLTNWKYTDPQSGAGSYKADEVDLDELYAQLPASAAAGGAALKNPTGNLVDTMA